MKLFKEKQEERSNISLDKDILYAPDLQKLKNYDKKIDFYILNTTFGLIEYKEYLDLMDNVYEVFKRENESLLDLLRKSDYEDLETIWDIVNQFLGFYSLGKSQILVYVKDKSIEIKHFSSPFVYYANYAFKEKTCKFLERLYSDILSSIFDKNIKMLEKECANETKKDVCIFKMV